MKLLYYEVKCKEDYAMLLSTGFGYNIKEPWVLYDQMITKYGEDSCIDIGYSMASISYAPRSWFLDKLYSVGSIDDVKVLSQRNNKDRRGKK